MIFFAGTNERNIPHNFALHSEQTEPWGGDHYENIRKDLESTLKPRIGSALTKIRPQADEKAKLLFQPYGGELSLKDYGFTSQGNFQADVQFKL